MRIKKVIIGLLVGASLIAGQATVGAWNGNTAASPDTYGNTQINTTPGNLGRSNVGRVGNPGGFGNPGMTPGTQPSGNPGLFTNNFLCQAVPALCATGLPPGVVAPA